MTDVAAVIKAAVEGNVAVFYPCECDEHESGYEHFVDQLAAALQAALGLAEVQPKQRGLYEGLTIRDRSRSKAQARIIGGMA